jgi:ribosome biogenesis GTPase
MSAPPTQSGTVIATHGRQFQVATESGQISCVVRGRKGALACGDQVRLTPTGPGAGVIESHEPRRNLLYRADHLRSKLLAANLDLALVVVACVPRFREELLSHCLIACEAEDIPAVIVLNKSDLAETAALADYLRHYTALDYELLQVSALASVDALLARIRDCRSVLVGPSGVGKSSLLNRLVPEAGASTDVVSQALDAGRHTTTHTRLYQLPGGGELIDSPGMQEFGLAHLDEARLKAAFPEIRQRAGHCRFSNCRHLGEPGCAVTDALQAGQISASRYRIYRELVNSLSTR